MRDGMTGKEKIRKDNWERWGDLEAAGLEKRESRWGSWRGVYCNWMWKIKLVCIRLCQKN